MNVNRDDLRNMAGNMIRVEIPQNCSDIVKILKVKHVVTFLNKLCEETKLKPIMKNNKVIGIIEYSKINEDINGIVSYGLLWQNINREFICESDNSYSFTSVSIEDYDLEKDIKEPLPKPIPPNNVRAREGSLGWRKVTFD